MEFTSDEENDSEKGGTPRKKQKVVSKKQVHKAVKYNPKLEAEFKWLSKVPSDEFKAMCKLCTSEFRTERSDIIRHSNSAKHKSVMKDVKPTHQPSAANMFRSRQTKLDEQVKYAEMKLSGFVAAHDEAFWKMDHMIDMLKDAFPDSKIAQALQLKRTKTKGVVINVIGQCEKATLAETLKNVKFSIMTDESTDISSVKTSCIMVRYYDELDGRIVSRFWDLVQVFDPSDGKGAEEGATGRRLFESLKKSFEDYCIPFENVIGFGSDGCNAMMGEHNSVASRMKKLCPNIKIMKCLCHSLHLCCSDACISLPRTCEDLARDVYNYFCNSSKRQVQFIQFQKFLEIDIHKLLHPSQTRWLSLIAVVNRLLEQWDALTMYFDTASILDHLKSAVSISAALRDPFIKTYFYFLQWILPKITRINELFQSEKTISNTVHERMILLYSEILTSFIRRDYISRTDLQDIDPKDRSKWLDLKELYLGIGVMKQLQKKEILARPDLIADFRTRCRQFFVVLCTNIKKRYDFSDKVMLQLRLFTPAVSLSQKERETEASLFPLAQLLPRNIDQSEQTLQRLDDEWRQLPLDKLPEKILLLQNDIDQFWHELYIYEDEIGLRPYATLAAFALTALSIPVSNADCERKFSKVNSVKTKKRNRLITHTVNGILLADQAVRRNGNCCMGFKPTSSMLKQMNSKNIYMIRIINETTGDDDIVDLENDYNENIFSGIETFDDI